MEYGPIVDGIVDAESRFPVATWTIDGLHVWPLIRIRLYPLLAGVFGARDGIEEQIRRSQQTGGRSVLALAGAALRRIAAAPRTAAEARTVSKRLSAPADALFYSLSHMRANVNGLWHDRHCDPLIDILMEQRGLSSILLESAYDVPHRTPRANDNVVVDADSWVRFTARRGRSLDERTGVSMKSYDAFLRWLVAEFPGIDTSQLQVKALRREARSVAALRGAFEVALDNSGVRACFVACYYHDPGMALAWACRRKGIPCVDLQHGMQANPAYSRWTAVPVDGYELLPEVFWNWTLSESQGIRSWADKTGGAHRSIVGGFPWLDIFSAEQPVKVSAPESLRILFSMPTFEYELPEWIFSSIAQSPSGWTWSFRLHPRQQKAREELRALLQATTTQATWELDAASDLPLPTVLRNIDVHVTHSSSVILEAEYFGIRSVAIQHDAARSFENQTSTGVLVIATDSIDLIEAIKTQGAIRQRIPHQPTSGRTQTLKALDALLQPSAA